MKQRVVQDAENNDATMSEIHAIVQAYQDQQASEMNTALKSLSKVFMIVSTFCSFLG